MNMIKTMLALALGVAFVAGCGAKDDESAAQTDTAEPAVESPAMPADEPAPVMSDSLPTAEEPPPPEPSPPPGN